MKRGLTLGKYAPLHFGHQAVIETGLAEMDEMTVIIYDAAETTPIPLGVRSGWLRALYPTVKIIEAWDGPTEVGYTPDLMRAHERYIIDALGIKGVTHFYSSEPYGEHMSRALGAVDRRVDEGRVGIPVSGSKVRLDPYGNRAWVHPLVYRDLIINVVFLGAPCTGKTTLARRLASLYNTQWMPEYGRAYWEEHQVLRRLAPQQLVEIAEGHLLRENALLERANRFLFTDTNAITTLTFARYYHGRPAPHLEELAAQALRRYDLTFVCDTDIPYDHTWDRSGEVKRAAFQRQVIGDLNERRVPFLRLGGSLEERCERVRNVLSRFKKFMNVFELFGEGAC